jgi:predicted TIM-barrel fold metal-dependent hydrolase
VIEMNEAVGVLESDAAQGDERALFETPIVDCDSHIIEPPDLWTARVPSRWRDQAPRPEWDGASGDLRWRVGDRLLNSVVFYDMAGWREYPPSRPRSLDEADPGGWDPKVRLQRMNEYGVYAQVLYPNLLSFSTREFLRLDPALARVCVEAYNDWLVEFAETDPRRLIPVMMLPFWDIDASCEELDRATALGHRGVLLASKVEQIGLPPLWDPHWSPLLAAIEERGLSINFHVGFAEATQEQIQASRDAPEHEHARNLSVQLMSNAWAVAAVICSGLCHRYPDINFVSIESGGSWMPYLMESLDWHWKNMGARAAFSDMELPSFYLKRQVLGSFWFERESIRRVIDLLADNMMFETDFPHPTSLSPGPASAAEHPRSMAEAALAGVDAAIVRKVFFENAARVYHLDQP